MNDPLPNSFTTWNTSCVLCMYPGLNELLGPLSLESWAPQLFLDHWQLLGSHEVTFRAAAYNHRCSPVLQVVGLHLFSTQSTFRNTISNWAWKAIGPGRCQSLSSRAVVGSPLCGSQNVHFWVCFNKEFKQGKFNHHFLISRFPEFSYGAHWEWVGCGLVCFDLGSMYSPSLICIPFQTLAYPKTWWSHDPGEKNAWVPWKGASKTMQWHHWEDIRFLGFYPPPWTPATLT